MRGHGVDGMLLTALKPVLRAFLAHTDDVRRCPKRATLAMVVSVVATTAFGLPARAAEPSKACIAEALANLKSTLPEGFSIYERLKQKSVFTFFIKCGDEIQLGMTTAVHEGVHGLTSELNAYPLINGQSVPLVGNQRALFRPGLVAPKFNAQSAYVSTYLMPGQATSADEFGFLLNELNAYTHDLNAAVKLRRFSSTQFDVFHRDGLAALMAFTAAYVGRARKEDATAWTALQQPAVKTSVSALWAQAEQVMGASCRIPRYAQEAAEYLAPVCAANFQHGLGQLLGRPPLCPVTCLRQTADAGRNR
jgi:hypothetical protein